jgi:2,4-diaminopentanoate dehydrogenase
MAYRVIQWATGNVGRAAVEGIIAHPDLELVGAWVHSPNKAGRDVGALCGIGPLGVLATGDEDRLLALDADCVLYSPLLPDTAQVIRILESGKNVVTPIPYVCRAEPGIRRYLDLPLIAGRHRASSRDAGT